MPQGEPADDMGLSSNVSRDGEKITNIRLKSDRASFLNGSGLINAEENQI